MEAFFLSAANGQRFCLLHKPPLGHPVRGGVVYIHPLAEELNRSRHVAALQARTLALAGYVVLQIDLYGCGDSSGDFCDATWDTWVADVLLARQHLATQLGCVAQTLWLWGLRSGCLLGAAVALHDADNMTCVAGAGQATKTPVKLLFWQPVLSGQQHLNQFLRLKMATDLVQGKRSAGTAELVQQLAGGQPVEVGGYTVSPGLASGLAQATLDVLGTSARVVCFEVSGASVQALSPALMAQLERWQSAGCQATAHVVQGPFFWQTAEPDACPALIAASLGAVQSGPP